MARKTFISYKYSEARDLRDKILKALGEDATFYQGETKESPDMTDTSTENIKKNLKDMMHKTTVTIVVLSPNIKQSKWIDWEIEYSLKEITRENTTSRTNGIVGVIMEVDGNYNWLVGQASYSDGCKPRIFQTEKLYNIIKENRFNLKDPKYICEKCKTVNKLSGSYISLIAQDEFLENPSDFIENAYDKSKNMELFNISKTR